MESTKFNLNFVNSVEAFGLPVDENLSNKLA